MRHAEEWAVFSAYTSARDFFRAMQAKRRAADYWREVSVEGIEAIQRSGERVGRGGISDPTANRAAAIVDIGDKVVQQARERLDECETFLAAGLIVIESVRIGLGAKYADALDLHYMDGLSERDTADMLGVSRSTVLRYISTACDWCDWRAVRLFY